MLQKIAQTFQIRKALLLHFSDDGKLPVSPLKNGVAEVLYDSVDATDVVFRGRKWREVDLYTETKNVLSGCLTVMSDEAFEYYLPAFLNNFIEGEKNRIEVSQWSS